MPQKDTDEIFEHRRVPNTVVVCIAGVLRSTFLECFECYCVVDIIEKLTQYCHLEHFKSLMQTEINSHKITKMCPVGSVLRKQINE